MFGHSGVNVIIYISSEVSPDFIKEIRSYVELESPVYNFIVEVIDVKTPHGNWYDVFPYYSNFVQLASHWSGLGSRNADAHRAHLILSIEPEGKGYRVYIHKNVKGHRTFNLLRTQWNWLWNIAQNNRWFKYKWLHILIGKIVMENGVRCQTRMGVINLVFGAYVRSLDIEKYEMYLRQQQYLINKKPDTQAVIDRMDSLNDK